MSSHSHEHHARYSQPTRIALLEQDVFDGQHEERIRALELRFARLAGAIAVLALLGSVAGGAIANALF